MRLTNTIKEAFIKAVAEGLPKLDKYGSEQYAADVAALYFSRLPEDVKKLRKKYPGMLATTSKCFKVRGEHLGSVAVYVTVPLLNNDIEVDTSAAYAKWEDSAKAEKERKALLAQLRAAADRCNTVPQLEQAYPDLAKYIPKVESKAYALVTGDIVKSLKEAGLK